MELVDSSIRHGRLKSLIVKMKLVDSSIQYSRLKSLIELFFVIHLT